MILYNTSAIEWYHVMQRHLKFVYGFDFRVHIRTLVLFMYVSQWYASR